jgi:long-subunit fatty acid transport protein
MKKISLLLAFSVGSLLLSAQEQPRFTIGTKGGFGHSYIMPYKNSGFHGSWHIGLTTAYQFTDRWALGADALYSSEGATFKSTVDENLEISTELDYMRIPIKGMYYLAPAANDFRMRLSVGPTFGVLMAEDTGYKDMDFGLNAGLGFTYEMLEDFWLTTDVSYYHGLMDIYAGNTESDRNGNIRLDIGFTFGL